MVKKYWGTNNGLPGDRPKRSVQWRSVMREKMKKAERQMAIRRCISVVRGRFVEKQTYRPRYPSTLTNTAEKATATAKRLASFPAMVPFRMPRVRRRRSSLCSMIWGAANEERRAPPAEKKPKKQARLFDYFKRIGT